MKIPGKVLKAKYIAKCIYDLLVEETGFTGGESYRN